MRDADNIHAVSQLGVDLIGLIFYPKSPRFVRMISSQAGIIPDYSELRLQNIREHGSIQQQIDSSKSDVHFVGVFVDEMPQNIITRIYNYNLDYVQLHGNESVFMIDNLRCTVDPDIKPGLKIIKAISIEKPEDIDKYQTRQREERRIPERVHEACILQGGDVVAEADEGRVADELELAEGQIDALDEGPDKADDKSRDDRSHEKRRPFSHRSAEIIASRGSLHFQKVFPPFLKKRQGLKRSRLIE